MAPLQLVQDTTSPGAQAAAAAGADLPVQLSWKM
jgi:hypothetical protein